MRTCTSFNLQWGELCEAFLLEAKWTHNKYIPTLEDYLDNAWRSVSGVVLLTHGYFLTNQEIKTDSRVSLEECHDLMKWSSMYNKIIKSNYVQYWAHFEGIDDTIIMV